MHISSYFVLVMVCSVPLALSHAELGPGSECGPVDSKSTYGDITSPGYPTSYPDNISCKWLIEYPPGANLTVKIMDVDIEDDIDCESPPCCTHNSLSLGSHQICGRNMSNLSIVLTNGESTIKFHTSKAYHSGRGFHLMYHICRDGQFRCNNERSCIDKELLCDGIDHCTDGSDEEKCDDVPPPSCNGENMVVCGGIDRTCYNNKTGKCNGIAECPFTGNDERDCGACGPEKLYCKGGGCYPTSGWCDNFVHCANGWDEGIRGGCGSCPPDFVSCGHPDNCHCFRPKTQRCDKQLDCPHGQDEISCDERCKDSIACKTMYSGITGQVCYNPDERCDGIPQCSDRSDEEGCLKPEENKFRCADNGRCIDDLYICNGVNDCSDGSDEANCIKNSIITAVVMGSLACGMIAVLGAAMGWRYYYNRCTMPAVISVSSAGGGGYRRQADQGPLDEASLYHLYREPPPSYHEAMRQDGNTPTYCHPTRYMNMTTRRTDTNVPPALPRRERSIRPRPPQPLPKPPQLVKPAEETSQTTSQIIAGDQLYPESSISMDQDTPMLELSDNNVNTSGVEMSGQDTDSRSPSGTSMSSLISCESQTSYQHPS